MQFWIPAGALLFLVTCALLFGPKWLAQRARTGAGGLAVLKHQLSELDADTASGRIPVGEAEGLRNELSRRILSASRAQGLPVGHADSPRLLALALLIPVVATIAYLQVGRPGMPDVPRAARMANAEKNGDMEALVAQVEEHLAAKPDDPRGWQILIPVYMDMGRYGDAAEAQIRIMALTGETPELKAGVAEALTLRDSGLMPELAVTSALDAFRLDPKNPKAQFYRALALSQTGKKDEAISAFKAMLDTAPPDAPWRKMVQEQMARISSLGAAPQMGGDQAAAVQNMAPADQQAMIRTMVDGLDAKLAANGNDIEGWLRLIRARAVLGESDKANAALAKARQLFASQTEALASLDSLAKELGLK